MLDWIRDRMFLRRFEADSDDPPTFDVGRRELNLYEKWKLLQFGRAGIGARLSPMTETSRKQDEEFVLDLVEYIRLKYPDQDVCIVVYPDPDIP